MLLRELNIDDRFIHANVKDKRVAVKYRVLRKCEYNGGHGTSTRWCINEKTKEAESKSCNLRVIKLPNHETKTT